MTSDSDLLKQPDTFQQSSLTNKNSNPKWTGFVSLLIILHLPFVLPLAYIISQSRLAPLSILRMNPFLSEALLPLAIIDLSAIILCLYKKSPPWIIFFIMLFCINIMFFHRVSWGLRQSGGGVAALAIVPLAAGLVIIDTTALLFYIIRIKPQGIAKVISYTALIVLIFSVLFGIPFL